MLSIINTISIQYRFHILTDSEENKNSIIDLFSSFINSNEFEIQVIPEKDKQEMDSVYYVESRKDITSFVFSQFYIPHYFGACRKLLFMEPDQIVRGDLRELWEEVHIKDIKLSAVESFAGELTLKTLELKNPGRKVKRFNAGVVIYDTEFWREMKLKDCCLEECRKQKESNGQRYVFYTEGAMNIACQEYFTVLDPKYNHMDMGWKENLDKEAIEKAIILHWNGTRKPWLAEGLYKEYYN